MSLDEFVVVHGENPVAITTVLEDARIPGETDQDVLQRYADKHNGFVFRVDDPKAWPDRAWRGQWRLDNKTGKIDVDIELVASTIMKQVRSMRDGKLSKLDVPSMRALEDGDTKTSNKIKNQKQALRDLPGNIEAKINKIVENVRKKNSTKLKELQSLKIPELED